jgi:RNA polymerase sigma-70 factor (ECF subfamily)
MWAYYDKTAEEIGEQLEMNKNAVDQLLFRAKANLKKYFESKEYAR